MDVIFFFKNQKLAQNIWGVFFLFIFYFFRDAFKDFLHYIIQNLLYENSLVKFPSDYSILEKLYFSWAVNSVFIDTVYLVLCIPN